MIPRIVLLLGTLAAILTTSALRPLVAAAKPLIALSLSGAYVHRNADGSIQLTAIDREQARPGERIRWQIAAANSGDQAARGLIAVGRIPAGTAFVPGSASSAEGRVEYTLDGRIWSASPTIVVAGPSGNVVKPADPGRYTAVRWIASAALPPHAVQRYTYEVMVR